MMNWINYITLICLILITGCFPSGKEGNGEIITSAYVFDHFDALYIEDAFHVQLYQSDDFYVEIEAEENLMDMISLQVIENVLHLSFKEKMHPNIPIKVNIAMPELSRVDIKGACKMQTTQPFITPNMEIHADGASKINMNVIADEIHSYSKGAAMIELSGSTGLLIKDMQGAGVFHGLHLDAYKAKINLNGVGKISVNVEESLNASVNGVGKVEYTGSPKVLDKKVSGLGKIVQVGS